MQEVFRKGMPEEGGIPSQAVLEFIEAIKESKVELHSFLMQYKEIRLAEGYYKPFHKDFQHRMYSISKSFTGLTIGLLEAEGKLSLEDQICSYFRDKCPAEGVHPYIEAMTIKDMLKMTTAHQSTTYKRYGDKDWVESFFCVAPTHYPGTIFNYDTSSSHVLAALVERLTGKELIEYLREKVLDEIGFSKEAKFLKDPFGVSQGGSGLVCTTRDLAAMAYVCTNGGKYQQKQLLPSRYLIEATTKKVDTSMQPFLDETYGYGYQFWRNRKEGFTMYGMGGQLAICFPEYNFFMITTANTIGRPSDLQQIYDAFYKTIYPYIANENHTVEIQEKTQSVLEERLRNLSLTKLEGTDKSEMINKIQGKAYKINGPCSPIKEVRFEFSPTGGRIYFKKQTEEMSIQFGYETYIKQKFPGSELEGISIGAWIDEKTLIIKCEVIEDCFATLWIQIYFGEETVTVKMQKGIELFMAEYNGMMCGRLK